MKNHVHNRLPPVSGHIFNLTLNLVFVGLVYVVLGVVISYILRLVFPEFDEKWKKTSTWFQVADVSVEISLIVVIAFWATYAIHFLLPVLPVSPALEYFIEVYGGRVMFVYAIFIFMRSLDDKLTYLFSVPSHRRR